MGFLRSGSSAVSEEAVLLDDAVHKIWHHRFPTVLTGFDEFERLFAENAQHVFVVRDVDDAFVEAEVVKKWLHARMEGGVVHLPQLASGLIHPRVEVHFKVPAEQDAERLEDAAV